MSLMSVFDSAAESEERPPLPSITLDTTTLLDLLQNERRRHVINLLAQCEQLTITDAAEIVAAKQYGKAAADLDAQERKRVYISLYQTHGPKLAKHGLVVCDQEKGIIAATPLTETADEIAGALDEATVNEGEPA